jgi:anti-sigma regulatory factor (Ser/Thr protein kinase)
VNHNDPLPVTREQFFDRRLESVPAARGFTARVLAIWGVQEHLEEVLLCVSELTTNALRHGVPPGRGFLVRLVVLDGVLRVEVHDSGDGRPEVCHPSGEEECGRGLMLVGEVADKWGVGESWPGKNVWCDFTIVSLNKRGESAPVTL